MVDTGTTAPSNNLLLRVASAVVMAPLAIAAAYLGGWPFALFWAAASIAVLWEWTTLVSGLVWIAAGVGYAGIMFAAPVILRSDAELGMPAIMLLFTIVWTTDILGYFAGRAFGGPKLWPAVSPKKTWSGALAGTLGAIIVTVVSARWLGAMHSVAVATIALGLSVVAQLGDLLESAIKRKFSAKDASHLIPGHGGVMDRLDGFIAAALLAALIGAARGAPTIAEGLFVWP